MPEILRHKQHLRVFAREVEAAPLPERRRIRAQIHNHVIHVAGDAAHQLRLLLDQLEVRRANHAALGNGVEHFLQIVVNAIRAEGVNIVILNQAAAVVRRIKRLDAVRTLQIQRLKIKLLHHFMLPPEYNPPSS